MPGLDRLERVGLSRNYLSEGMVERRRGAGIAVVAGDQQRPEHIDEDDGEPYRFVAHSE
ncbi:MAG: hypothetical protein K2W96_20955 [Gemmataceae bacterium]|nr:hypothetical protein [Gemmataceae bacterium]